MLFAIDIGNSHTVVGVYDDNEMIAQWRVQSDRKMPADEIAVQFNALFDLNNITNDNITGIIISSVVPSLEAAWTNCCRRYYSKNLLHDVFIVNTETLDGLIEIDIDYPREVGADRLVNGIAGWIKYKTAVIVIDFGTAITFDCITKECTYIGGTILPGAAISLEALSNRAAKLPHIDISVPPQSIIGKNTVDAMKSGILYGYGAMIDGLVDKLGKEMVDEHETLNIIATGGMASLIIPYSKHVTDLDKLLTLQGLHHIFHAIHG